jgi:ATP-dependent Lon protease
MRLTRRLLRKHLETRIREFAEAAKASADSVAPKIGAGVEDVIRRRLQAIESSLKIASQGEKEQVKSYLAEMLGMVSNFAADPKASPARSAPMPAGLAAVAESRAQEQPGATVEDSLREQHYEIQDGATGYTYERIFRPYLDTAEEIRMEDPHIRKPYQIDNLVRFCALAVRIGRVKKIALVTGEDFGEDLDEINSRLESLRRDLGGRDIALEWRRDEKLHDREMHLDNGWVIKIGRGLDIYQKPESWVSVAAADFSLRPCRQTKVDVFKR